MGINGQIYMYAYIYIKVKSDENDKWGKPYKRYIIKSGPLIGFAVSRY